MSALGLGAIAGAGEASPQQALGWRFGRAEPPRISVSLPQTWFLTERLTDVGDPVQLFAISNRRIPAPHANIHGLVNPRLIPTDAVLVTAHAFELTLEMEVYASRTSLRPPKLRLSNLQGIPFGDLGLTTHSWSHTGMTFGVQIFVWVGDRAAVEDVAILDAVLGSITFDQPL